MMMYSTWRRTPLHVRHEIAYMFGIPKSGPTHVVDNQVQDDGYKVEEIESKITVPALEEVLKPTEKYSLEELFDMLVAHLTSPAIVGYVAPQNTIVSSPEVITELITPEPGTVESSMAKPERIKVEKVPTTKKAAKPKTK